LHTKVNHNLYGVSSVGGLGVDSRLYNKLERISVKDYPFNLDFLLLSENKIFKRAQERLHSTFFYYTRRVHNFLLLTESP